MQRTMRLVRESLSCDRADMLPGTLFIMFRPVMLSIGTKCDANIDYPLDAE
jgi:hypothetical protein